MICANKNCQSVSFLPDRLTAGESLIGILTEIEDAGKFI